MNIRASLLIPAIVTGLVLVGPTPSSAQPSQAQMQRDGNPRGAIRSRFLGPGTVTRNLRTRVWEFHRNVEVVRPSGLPGVNLVVNGVMVYHSTNNRNWTYQRTMTTSNRYDGIPDPTAEEIDALIRSQPAILFRGIGSQVVGMPILRPALAADTQFIWHEPTSVSFSMVVQYDTPTSYTTVVRQTHRYAIRMYRPALDQPWNNYIANSEEVLSTEPPRTFTADQVRAMPRFSDIIAGRAEAATPEEFVARVAGGAAAARGAEQAARAATRVQPRAAGLPAVQVPAFARSIDGVVHLHSQLMRLERPALESYLRAILAPRFFSSPGELNAEGVQLLSNALYAILGHEGTYRSQFCVEVGVDRSRAPQNGMYLRGGINDVHAIVAFEQVGNTWKLNRLEVATRSDADALEYVRSRPRSEVCAGER